MEEGVGRQTGREVVVIGFDFETPWERGGLAEKFLVKVVAPASHGLSQEHTGCDRIGHRQHAQPVATTTKPHADRSPNDRAPDRDATFPDGKDLPGVSAAVITGPEINVRDGDDVVEPSPDDAKEHGP